MVYILLGDGFEEAEALVTADVLRRGGAEVFLTGLGRRTTAGAHGIVVTADRVAEDVKLLPGDMLVLPGGMGGVAAIEGSNAAMALVQQAAADDAMWLAAICAAPAMLARRGVIGPGNDAVCYPGMEGELLGAGVAAHMDVSVVVDGRLITGRAPGSAIDFGLELLAALKGVEAAEQVQREMHYGQ